MYTQAKTENSTDHIASVLDLGNELLLEEIDNTSLDERFSAWKHMQLDARPRIRAERAVLAAESWKQTKGEDVQIRRARLLAHILENIPVQIHDWQLFAGGESPDLFCVNPDVDLCTTHTIAAMVVCLSRNRPIDIVQAP